MTLQSIINDITNIKSKINTRFNAYQKTLSVDFNVFIHNPDIDLSYIDKPCNIILSPMFYWVKKESLPVSNTNKASRLAPSCFGAQVPEGEYKYFAIKDGQDGDFMLFAYDENKIINTLKNSKIDLSLINKIYLTQNEFDNDIIQIQDDKCLYKRDDIYVILPTSLLKEDIPIESLENAVLGIKQSKYNISINLSGGSLDPKHINILGISLLIIMLSLSVRYYILKDDYNKVAQKEQSIINKYKIPTSSLRLKSIKKSLQNKLSKETRIKENIQNIFDIPLKRGDFVRDIEIIDKRFHIAIELKDKNNTSNSEDYKEYLIQYFNLKALKVKDGILKIKGEF